MRILMLNYEFPPIGGGGGIVTYYLAKNMTQLGHDVCVVTSRFRDLPENEELDGFRICRVPALRKRADVCEVHEMFTYVLSASLHTLRFAKRFKPNIVQVFFGIPSGPVGYLLKKLYNLPYVVFLGGRDVPRPDADPPYYRFFYAVLGPAIKSIWGNAAAVIACSDGLRRLAGRTDKRARVEVIPDGIDLRKFPPKRHQADPALVRILTIARLIPRKGVQYLIQAIADVIGSTRTEFEVEIVGDGPMREELIQLAQNLKVSHKLHFVGRVPYDRLPEYYAKADIFVLSSLREGMPLVVLEAMASGLPIVASKVEGIEDLVEVGQNGYLFAPKDWRSLGQHIVAVLNDGHRRVAMGQQSIRLVEKYDWSNIAKMYLETYRRLLVEIPA